MSFELRRQKIENKNFLKNFTILSQNITGIKIVLEFVKTKSHIFVICPRPEPSNFLIKNNASVSAVDKLNRNTPLHCAVLAGNVDAAHVLLSAGASVDTENINVSLRTEFILQNKMKNAASTQKIKNTCFFCRVTHLSTWPTKCTARCSSTC